MFGFLLKALIRSCHPGAHLGEEHLSDQTWLRQDAKPRVHDMGSRLRIFKRVLQQIG